MPSPVLVVHGGAWAIPDSLTEASVRGVEAAARAGWEVLVNSGSALDAVEAATRVLEDDESFDAGRGAVLNENGEVELDAVIMDGRDLDSGAVAALVSLSLFLFLFGFSKEAGVVPITMWLSGSTLSIVSSNHPMYSKALLY